MEKQLLFEQILNHFDDVIAGTTDEAKTLRKSFDMLHPADMADFFELLDDEQEKKMFLSLSSSVRLEVFKEFSAFRQANYLSFLDGRTLHNLLGNLPVDELIDCFDELSDEELKRYLKLLQKREREQVVSVLKLDEGSAGRHMDMNVFSLLKDFTVAQSIQILQRLQPDQDLHRNIFVTTNKQQLVGSILLEDLVLKSPSTKLSTILRPVDFSVFVDEDQEDVAQKMTHYDVMNVPVVDRQNVFLGVISATGVVGKVKACSEHFSTIVSLLHT